LAVTNTHNAQEIAAASEQQAAAAHEITNLVENLKDMAEQMDGLVMQFKVE
jgi:methyl-accepting chemotaxis protein